MDVKFDITTRLEEIFICMEATHARDFILYILIEWLDQDMSQIKYYNILRYRLMIPLFPIDDIFPICRKTCLDTFWEHVTHY